MAHLLLILAAAQRSSLVGSSIADACANPRNTDPRCSLLFPDDDLEYDFKRSKDSGSGAYGLLREEASTSIPSSAGEAAAPARERQ